MFWIQLFGFTNNLRGIGAVAAGLGLSRHTLRHAPQLSKSALINDNVEYNARIRKENQKYFSSFCWSLVELYFVF